MAKLKVGVFGAYRGKLMIEVLVLHPDAEVVAVCDKYRPLLDEVLTLAKEHDKEVTVYENFDEFIKHDMDAVIMANYANEHATYAIKALNAGMHVLSEVLPCETMAQAIELIEAVEKSGKVYAYAENYCYMSHSFEMWRRCAQGDLGTIQYMEGEYVHDCSAIWPSITYGEREHWRNRMYSTYYCTHSIGPMITMSGLRPVQVVGFEMPAMECMYNLGSMNGGKPAMEIVTFENGACGKSIHGCFKREPGSVNYQVYGTKGMIESERFDDKKINVYIEGDKLCIGDLTNYAPEKFVSKELSKKFPSHSGSDFYATHFFIEKILGKEEGKKYSIDVYTAVEMGICGILAYRSILNGNKPIKVPNLRNIEERDEYRSDNACVTPSVAEEQLLPPNSGEVRQIPDEVYSRVREIWKSGKNAE